LEKQKKRSTSLTTSLASTCREAWITSSTYTRLTLASRAVLQPRWARPSRVRDPLVSLHIGGITFERHARDLSRHAKPFDISKREVSEAYKKVKSNRALLESMGRRSRSSIRGWLTTFINSGIDWPREVTNLHRLDVWRSRRQVAVRPCHGHAQPSDGPDETDQFARDGDDCNMRVLASGQVCGIVGTAAITHPMPGR
jgi:hypothetical protein